MSGRDCGSDGATDAGRRQAVLRTRSERPHTVAAALRPDNTAEMSTTVDGDTVVTRIERETTGGLHATVDDYVVNLDVATRVTRTAAQFDRQSAIETDTHTDTNDST